MIPKNISKSESSNIEDMIFKAVKRCFDEIFPNNILSHNPADEGYYDSKELCDKLHISPTSLWRRENEGVLKCHLIGGRKLYSKMEVQKLVESGKLAKFNRKRM